MKMKLCLDQSTDFSGKEVYNYLKGVQVPEYVKEAEVDDFESLNKLPKEAFADPMRGAYPINSPARVYISNVYFSQKRARLEETLGPSYVKSVEAKIKQAAEIFDILEDVKDYSNTAFQKQASDYAPRHVSTMENGDTTFELFPYKTAADLTQAAEQFTDNLAKFPMDWRFKIASDFVKAAKEINVNELPDLLCKYAGMFYTTPDHVVNELKRRSYRLKQAENKKIYTEALPKLANDLDDVEDIKKIAEICYYVERNEGIDFLPKVAAVLGDPVDKFFNLDIVKTAELLDVVEVSGENYKFADLQNIGSDIYEKAFGFEIDPRNKQALAEVMPTVPMSDMQLFRELSGVQPI